MSVVMVSELMSDQDAIKEARRKAFEEAMELAHFIGERFMDDKMFGDDHDAACCHANGAFKVANELWIKMKSEGLS